MVSVSRQKTKQEIEKEAAEFFTKTRGLKKKKHNSGCLSLLILPPLIYFLTKLPTL